MVNQNQHMILWGEDGVDMRGKPKFSLLSLGWCVVTQAGMALLASPSPCHSTAELATGGQGSVSAWDLREYPLFSLALTHLGSGQTGSQVQTRQTTSHSFNFGHKSDLWAVCIISPCCQNSMNLSPEVQRLYFPISFQACSDCLVHMLKELSNHSHAQQLLLVFWSHQLGLLLLLVPQQGWE